jgi:DNA-binding transcriptional ArsR family regulator
MTPQLLPRREPVPEPDREEHRFDVGDEAARTVLRALSSDCALEIFRRLRAEPMTTTDVAEAVDTSLQNAAYHLGNLEDAGLVEVADTWYSSRGAEMAVYAVTVEHLVLDVSGPD